MQQRQEQQEAQHAQIDETAPIQIIDSFEQLAQRRHGEQSQEQDLTQEIEQMLEQMDTDMVYPEPDQDIDLMPQNQEVTPLVSPDLEV